MQEPASTVQGWKTKEINGIGLELNSIRVEKWKGKAYRLVIQRQRRIDGTSDIWEGEYTYRCILTNDYTATDREIVEFYNKRGGKERIFDDMDWLGSEKLWLGSRFFWLGSRFWRACW